MGLYDQLLGSGGGSLWQPTAQLQNARMHLSPGCANAIPSKINKAKEYLESRKSAHPEWTIKKVRHEILASKS